MRHLPGPWSSISSSLEARGEGHARPPNQRRMADILLSVILYEMDGRAPFLGAPQHFRERTTCVCKSF